MSANLNIVDLLKRKAPNPFGEVGSEPLRSSSSPAIQRAALSVPNGDVVALLKQQGQQDGKNPSLESLGYPKPRPVSDSGSNMPAAPLEQVGEYVVPKSIGTKTAGMDDTERQQAKISLLRRSDPTSKIKQVGDVIEEGPPEQSPSRGKNFLLELLRGTAKYGVAGGIGGGLRGLIDPKGAEQDRRDEQVAREEGKLGRQYGLEKDAAQVDEIRSRPVIAAQREKDEADYRKESIRIRDAEESGRISRDKAEELQKELDRKSREKISADDNASREKIAGMPSRSDNSKDEDRGRKASAAKAEYDQLVNDEQKAGVEKNNAYEYLAKLKGDPNIPKEDIAEATKAAEDANKLYQSFGEKKRDAQTRMRENTVEASSADRRDGYTMTAANLARYAKDKGLSLEDARKQVEAQGVKVQ